MAELAPVAVADGAGQQERQGQVQDQGLDMLTFMNYVRDIQFQPAWRADSDKCVDYYDGNQLDQATLSALEQKNMGPLIKNIIAPICNVVLGMEAKTRANWRVGADSDEWTDVAEAFSAKLMEMERETRADRACADAYAGQIKAGIGWVEVWRNFNPFEYQYRVGFVHRREIFWDWRDQTHDLRKSRYLLRKRWYEVDEAKAFFPKYADFFNAAMGGDQLRSYLLTKQTGLTLANAMDQDRGLALEDFEEWRSMERRRVCLYEMWYRRYVRGYVLRLPNGDVVELNMKNPLHIALLSRGVAKPEQALYSKMRMSIWCGPLCLTDCAVKNDYTPYIPFWGYREDRTGVPYGLIRNMISPQDEVNARRQKMLWLLGAKRVTMDADALHQESNTTDAMLQEISRADAVVVLNPNRKNTQGAFTVDNNLGMTGEEYKIMQDSEEAAQKVVGVFNALLGRDSSTTSGVAINSLVEQGTTALAEINDNYRFGRRLVGERSLELLRDDMIGQQVTVMVGEQGKRKSISLNQPAVHQPSGLEIMVNDVRGAKIKVALEDVPSTASYRQQQLTMLSEVMKGLPPQLQAAIAPFYLEATDLSKRREMADAARKAMGIVEPRTPEEQQQMQQEQAEQKAIQKEMVMSELRQRNAKAALLQAQAEKARAEASGLGMDEQQSAAFEAELKRLVEQGQRDVDQLTAQIMAERGHAKLREQALKNKMAADQTVPDESKGQDQVAALKEQLDALTQTVTEEIAKLGAKVKKPALAHAA